MYAKLYLPNRSRNTMGPHFVVQVQVGHKYIQQIREDPLYCLEELLALLFEFRHIRTLFLFICE